ncbi:MAG: hypothetical protein ACLP07_05000 [Terracidiphilus sp.]
MRRVVLGSLLGFACFAYAQQPVGDVYESGSGAGTPAQAVQNLYQLAAKITADPSSGYDPKTDHWPEADAAWQQWDNSMALNGNALTQQQRQGLVPCAAHLGAAIDSAERSYRIEISQAGNSAAQATAQKLLGAARSDFAQCNLAEALQGSDENPATGGTGPGSDSGGTPGGGSGPPIQGGVSTGPNSTPGTTGGGGPGTPPTTGTEPGPPASQPPTQPPGSKGITRTPVSPSGNGTQPPAGPDIAAMNKAMNACLSEHVPYWKEQAVDPAAMATARILFLPDAKQSIPMDQLPANSQIFLEAAAYGVQASKAHTSEYGPDSGAGKYKYSQQDAADYMTGWLYHCMYRDQLTPQSTNFSANYPTLLYSQFLNVPETDSRVNLFSSGFKEDTLPPYPMLPPGKTVFPLVQAPR